MNPAHFITDEQAQDLADSIRGLIEIVGQNSDLIRRAKDGTDNGALADLVSSAWDRLKLIDPVFSKYDVAIGGEGIFDPDAPMYVAVLLDGDTVTTSDFEISED